MPTTCVSTLVRLQQCDTGGLPFLSNSTNSTCLPFWLYLFHQECLWRSFSYQLCNDLAQRRNNCKACNQQRSRSMKSVSLFVAFNLNFVFCLAVFCIFSITRCSRSDVCCWVSEWISVLRLDWCDPGEWWYLLKTVITDATITQVVKFSANEITPSYWVNSWIRCAFGNVKTEIKP